MGVNAKVIVARASFRCIAVAEAPLVKPAKRPCEAKRRDV